jgi:hypothetical protein
MVKFESTKEEYALMSDIADRASKAGLIMPAKKNYSRQDFLMDLDAVNSNGCPMNFEKMLAAPDFDFVHDVAGIYRHIDRETGQLTDCFIPRCAR